MPHPTLIVCFVISVVVAFFVIYRPLFGEQQKIYFDSAHGSTDFVESLSYLEMINELEIDYKMGKVSEEDFEILSLEYKRQYLTRKKEEKARS